MSAYGHSSLSSCCPNIFKKETALLPSNCIFQGMNPNTLQEPNGSRRLWMSSHHFHWLSFTVGMCDVVVPTLSNSEKLIPFCYLLTFFLLCWEEGFANNQAISYYKHAKKKKIPPVHHNVWNSKNCYWLWAATDGNAPGKVMEGCGCSQQLLIDTSKFSQAVGHHQCAAKAPWSVLRQQRCPRTAPPALTSILPAWHLWDGPGTISNPHQSGGTSPNTLHRTGFHAQDGLQFHLHFSQMLLISTETIPINASWYRGRRKPFLQSPRASATKRRLGRMHEWPDCVHFQEGIHMYSSASSSACARLCSLDEQSVCCGNKRLMTAFSC